MLFRSLNAGGTLTDTFTISTLDGVSQLITITITGANDIPVIAGVSNAAVSEDAAPVLTASGLLTISDVDAGQSSFVARNNVVGVYGTFNVDASGNWTYAASNSAAAVQRLGNGDALQDVFSVTSVDGTAGQQVTVTINGVNDAPEATNAAVLTTDTANRVFHVADFGYSDIEGTPLASVRVVSLPGSGTLTLAGSPVTVNQQIAAADLDAGKLQFVPQQGNGVKINTSFAFQVSDGAAFSTAHTVAIAVDSLLAQGPALSVAPAVTTTTVTDAVAVVFTSATSSTVQATNKTAVLAAVDDLTPGRKSPLASTDEGGTSRALVLQNTQPVSGTVVSVQGFDDAALRRTVNVPAIGPVLLQAPGPVAGPTTLLTATIDRPVDAATSARVASAVTNATFTNELNRVRDGVKEQETLEQNVMVSSVTAGTGLSVLYLAWLLRGSVLLSTMLTSLPAWRFVDPLPVMGSLGDEEDEDGESIESIVADSGGNTA